MALRIEEFSGPRPFAQCASPFLERQESVNNLLFGMLHGLSHSRDSDGAYMAVVRQDHDVVLVAVRTPPFNLVLSEASDGEAALALARHLAAKPHRLPGVTAPKGLAEQFVTEWQALTDEAAYIQLAERIYELTEVLPVRNPGGNMRPSTDADYTLITEWIAQFAQESLVEVDNPAAFAEGIVAGRTADPESGFFLWDDAGPVSLLGFTGPTPTGIRVAPVYTPPHLRGRGYASKLVADASQALLDAGHHRVFLFTDLANPTSNHIYQQAGYRAVADVSQWAFQHNRTTTPAS